MANLLLTKDKKEITGICLFTARAKQNRQAFTRCLFLSLAVSLKILILFAQ